jgi:hypothetical protein
MTYRANYPATVAEVLDPPVRFKPAVDAAVAAYAASKPWRGNVTERSQKAITLINALADAYEIRPPMLTLALAGDYYSPATRTICLTESAAKKFSVITLLHEFGHALGKDERQTCRWSLNLFRKHFPRSFARLAADGHCLRAR